MCHRGCALFLTLPEDVACAGDSTALSKQGASSADRSRDLRQTRAVLARPGPGAGQEPTRCLHKSDAESATTRPDVAPIDSRRLFLCAARTKSASVEADKMVSWRGTELQHDNRAPLSLLPEWLVPQRLHLGWMRGTSSRRRRSQKYGPVTFGARRRKMCRRCCRLAVSVGNKLETTRQICLIKRFRPAGQAKRSLWTCPARASKK